ncbi:PEP-CTERM sorting domain-containing protein [Roseateles terrae]|uniref:Ice-binding protein C-terminal domain-containing protein n=1 Tax=Roseateles terrae TaxID=431060 RepID=A0ABR6GKK5_9BURK|nr:PEP-CTERM sorting domain-containing protein [Roseateles terrae]MBB3192641.1 hypothetical protein [Roseateles terrae]OWQ90066.1 hypothetical protein CDN98_06215 [Roseateles terrae]
MKMTWMAAVAALVSMTCSASASAQTYELKLTGSFTTRLTSTQCSGCANEWLDQPMLVPFSTTLLLSFGSGPVTGGVLDETSPYYKYYRIPDIAVLQPGSLTEALPAELVEPHDASMPTMQHSDTRSVEEYRTQIGGQTEPQPGSLGRSWTASRTEEWATVSGDDRWGRQLIVSGTLTDSLSALDAPFNSGAFVAQLYRDVGCVNCLNITGLSFWRSADEGHYRYGLGSATLVSLRELASPVPEPSSWLLTIAGLGLIAWRARRRVQALSLSPVNGSRKDRSRPVGVSGCLT